MIHCLLPLITQSSPSRLAFVCTPQTSEPALASLRPKQTVFSPLAISGRNSLRTLSLTGTSMCDGPSTNEAIVGWLRKPLAQVMSGRPGPYLRYIASSTKTMARTPMPPPPTLSGANMP